MFKILKYLIKLMVLFLLHINYDFPEILLLEISLVHVMDRKEYYLFYGLNKICHFLKAGLFQM